MRTTKRPLQLPRFNPGSGELFDVLYPLILIAAMILLFKCVGGE